MAPNEVRSRAYPLARKRKSNKKDCKAIPSSDNLIDKEFENEDSLNKAATDFEAKAKVANGIIDIKIKYKEDGPNKQTNSRVKNCKHSDLYMNQKHRALQEILLGPTVYCPISANKVEEHYSSILMAKSKCDIDQVPESLWPQNTPNNKANIRLLKKIKPNEVKTKLLSKIYNFLSLSRSVGLDRMTYKNLRTYDPDCSKMTVLFNACLKLETVPKIWFEFYSVLIPYNSDNSKVKENDMDDKDLLNINNWHPITMQRTISKIFQRLIASRLISWAEKTGRLSATQKGFLMHNAACESSFILQECKNYAEEKEKDLVVAWLDFTNSSNHIPQAAVLYALNKHSVPSPMIKIIEKILEFSNTKFRVTGDYPTDIRFTNVIPILNGLPQGSPITPILLDLVIEPLLKDLSNAVSDTFEIYNNKINHYAIPNELTLIVDSPTKLENLLKLVEKNAKLIGLKFNIEKCSTYHYDAKEKQVKPENKFIFFGQKLSTLPEDRYQEFFGVKQGLSIGQNCCPSIQEMIGNIKKIDESGLYHYQKVESVLIYVIPRVEICLRGLQSTDMVSLGKADEITQSLEKAEEVLKDRFKCWLDLPSNATTRSIVYQVAANKQSIKEDMEKLTCALKSLSVKEEKKPAKHNYLPFMDLFYIMKVVHALKMLTSQDEIIKNLAFTTLTAEVNSLIPKKKQMVIEKKHLAQYLSGDLHTIKKQSKSFWNIVRDATLKLKIKIPLKWQHNNGMQLIIKFKDNEKNSIFNGMNINSIEDKLKITLVEYYIDETMKNSSGPEDNLKAIK